MESSLAQVVKELQSSNLAQDLILDTIDNYDFTLASNVAKEGTRTIPVLLEEIVRIIDNFESAVLFALRSNNDLLEELKGNRLQEREDRGELLDALEKLRPDKTKEKEKINVPNAPGGLFGTLGIIAGGLIGIAAGFIKEMSTIFLKPLQLLKDSKIYKSITGFIGKFGQFFDDIALRFKNSKLITKLTSTFEAIGEFINRFKNSGLYKGIQFVLTKIKGVLNIFSNSPVLRTLETVFDISKTFFSVIGDFFAGLRAGFTAGIKIGGTFAKIIKTFGRVFIGLGKILGWPLTVAIAVYEGITGFIRGFKEDGIIGGIKEAAVSIFDGLIGSILDLLKDGISWISEKLGFTEFSKFLDSFSFTDLYRKYFIEPVFDMYAKIGETVSNIFSTIKDFFITLPDKIGEYFTKSIDSLSNMSDGISDAVDKFNKSVLRSILPDPNEKYSYWNPLNLVREAVPDSLYEYAYGTPAKKQEVEKASSEKISSEKISSEKTSSEKTSSEKILKASSTNNFSELNKTEKALAAGYATWDEYAASNFKWKSNIQAMPAATGNTLATAGNISNISPTIVVNNNNGGNVSNISTSNVNNNAPTMMPIMTGSAMGY